jgi:hypothetical protein
MRVRTSRPSPGQSTGRPTLPGGRQVTKPGPAEQSAACPSARNPRSVAPSLPGIGSPPGPVSHRPATMLPGLPGPWRTYAPGLGRFLSQVRLAEAAGLPPNALLDEHPYTYATDSPTSQVDPAGLAPHRPKPVYEYCSGWRRAACHAKCHNVGGIRWCTDTYICGQWVGYGCECRRKPIIRPRPRPCDAADWRFCFDECASHGLPGGDGMIFCVACVVERWGVHGTCSNDPGPIRPRRQIPV